MEVGPDDWRSPLAFLINKGACGCCHGEQGDLREKERRKKKERKGSNKYVGFYSKSLARTFMVGGFPFLVHQTNRRHNN